MDLRRRLLSQSTVIFAARVFGAALVFLAQAVIARFWGAEVLGEYLLVIATANIVAVVLPLGFETIATYFAAEYSAKGEGTLLRRFMTRSYGQIAAMFVLLLILGSPLASLLGEPGKVLLTHWVPVCLMTLASSVIYCNGGLLIGLKRPFGGYFAETIFRPLLIIASVGVAGLALGSDGRLSALLWFLAIGTSFIAVLQFVWVVRAAGGLAVGGTERPQEWKRWWRFAMPWVLITLATDFFFDIDLLVLSNLLDRESLAVFGVCTRVFSLVAFGVTAVYAVTMPQMFERSVADDRAGFLRHVGDANFAAGGISVGLFALVAVGAPILLMLFGPEFAAGTGPLAVLCLTLCVRSLFGPAALVLSMHDRPYATLPAVLLGMVVLVGGNILLVPGLGLMGAAIAALVAQATWSAAMWLTAWRFAGIDVSIWPRLREMLMAARARDA